MSKKSPNDPRIKIKNRKQIQFFYKNHTKAVFSSKTTILTIHKLVAGDQGGRRGYRRGPRAPAAIARDQGAQRPAPGTKGPGGFRQGRRGPAAIARDQGAWRLSPGIDPNPVWVERGRAKKIRNWSRSNWAGP